MTTTLPRSSPAVRKPVCVSADASPGGVPGEVRAPLGEHLTVGIPSREPVGQAVNAIVRGLPRVTECATFNTLGAPGPQSVRLHGCLPPGRIDPMDGEGSLHRWRARQCGVSPT